MKISILFLIFTLIYLVIDLNVYSVVLLILAMIYVASEYLKKIKEVGG